MNSKPALLVVLKNGLAPVAEPIVCDDFRGPRSLLGEGTVLPKPVCTWGAKIDACMLLASRISQSRSVVLYDSSLDPNPSPELSIPADTYLAGRCTSAFDVAWELMRVDLLPEWGAVLASSQTGGRGRMRKPWVSPRGNLHVVFRLPRLMADLGSPASVLVGHLLVRAFGKAGFHLLLKWPNDLLDSSGRKVGGLLLEERDGILLAGLGVNLQEAPKAEGLRKEGAPPAGVLFADAGGEEDSPPAPFALWRALVSGVIEAYDEDVRGVDPSESVARAALHLAWKNRRVRVEDAGGVVEGICMGLTPAGGLLLDVNGVDREILSGSLFPSDL